MQREIGCKAHMCMLCISITALTGATLGAYLLLDLDLRQSLVLWWGPLQIGCKPHALLCMQ